MSDRGARVAEMPAYTYDDDHFPQDPADPEPRCNHCGEPRGDDEFVAVDVSGKRRMWHRACAEQHAERVAKIDLDDLERKARAADADEWQWRADDVLEGKHDARVVLFAEWYNDGTAGISCSIANRAHIAAVSPPVTLALVARIRQLEKIATRALGEWRAWHAEVDTSNAEAWKATEAEIEAMIRQVQGGVVRHPDAYPEPPTHPAHTIGS